MPLRKLSIREVRSRPVRSLLTLFSIVIGVSAIVAMLLASDSARLAQIAMNKSITGNTSLEIEAIGGTSFDAKPLDFVGELPGVAIASPILRRYSNMTLEPDEGTEAPDSASRYRVQLLGVIPKLDKDVRGYSLVAGNDLGESEGPSVLMDVSFAESAHVKLGSTVRFLTRSYLQKAKVVGFVKANDASAGIQSGLIMADLKTVQRWSKAVGKLDAIQIVLDKDVKPEAIQEAIKSRLPADQKNSLVVKVPTIRSQVATETTVSIEQGLRLAAAFALIISALIIYNTFQMNVGERRKQLGILRSMGATRKQLLWMIVREGLWLGVIGTCLGCVVGYFGSSLLRVVFSTLLEIEIPQSPWSIWPYLIATICGTLVAFAGAFFPAMRASRLSPAEAMKNVTTGDFGTSRLGWLILGSVLISIGLVLQLLAIRGYIDVSHAVLGAVLMIIGIVFLLPGILVDVTAWCAWLLSPFLRTEGKLARRQILRHRGRSALTIGIVFVAMGFGLGMASTVHNNIQNVEGWYNRAIIGDFFVRAAMPDMNSGQAADMPDGLTEKVVAMPGVALVDMLRFVSARSNENTVVVVVRKFNSNTQDFFDLVEGSEAEVMQGIHRGEVVLGSVLSQRLNLHLGDTIPLETNDGSSTLRVAGVTNDYIAGGLTLYLEAESAKRLLNVDGTDVIVVKAERDQLAVVEKQLRALCDENGMMFQSYADLIKIIRGKVNGAVAGLWAMLALAAIIAASGLINTLAMNILEQTREIGMLRVVAMTRAQIRKMVLAQALMMGLIGIIPGVLTSVWIAYVINLSTKPVTGHDVKFQLDSMLMFGAPVFELLVVVIAAMIPAERAARINLSSALQYE